eukprot:CAMPEP_0206371032 /NCGR_PEP_ID=MMETSP0294-20121207/6243_1 /ASSEMBLY_ACC=CAM_ASM_000327 /TAXON_ID=39354 /ORGANISM="Heterosigma akashiwo, Strain CCMP2393" /LENGTH=261 /DNA_ID=CAMNT_0053818085 /DNA_START=191 /DNA_END=973 /DNA_ORIENTATION=+
MDRMETDDSHDQTSSRLTPPTSSRSTTPGPQANSKFELGFRRHSHRREITLMSIAHYMPPTFPLHATLTESTHHVLSTSWKTIESEERNSNGQSNLTTFFDLFFTRLYIKSSLCEELFNTMPFKKKSKLLMRCIRFIRESSGISNRELRNSIFFSDSSPFLELEHDLPPSLISVFSETLVETVAHFSPKPDQKVVREAWAHATARVILIVLRKMVRDGYCGEVAVAVGECVVPSRDDAAPQQVQGLSDVLLRRRRWSRNRL